MTGADVVVVGAAHLDILADYESSESGRLDKVGRLNYSIGGTAYNVAVNLSRHYVETSLVTVLKEDSLFSDLIEKRLDENGVDTRYVERVELMPESGFVGLRCEGELVEAVTASGLTEVRLNREDLRRAIEAASVVVADCNLSEKQLGMVARSAADLETPLFVNGVSESKAVRIRATAAPVDVYSLSRAEATHLFGFDPLEEPTDRVHAEMESIQLRRLVVTADTEGYVVFEDGERTAFPAPDVDEVVSESGAGDALLAAIAHEYADAGALDWDAVHDCIDRYVTEVLSREGATTGAVTDQSELSLRDRFDAAVSGNVGQLNDLRSRYAWLDAAAAVLSFVAGLFTIVAVAL